MNTKWYHILIVLLVISISISIVPEVETKKKEKTKETEKPKETEEVHGLPKNILISVKRKCPKGSKRDHVGRCRPRHPRKIKHKPKTALAHSLKNSTEPKKHRVHKKNKKSA